MNDKCGKDKRKFQVFTGPFRTTIRKVETPRGRTVTSWKDARDTAIRDITQSVESGKARIRQLKAIKGISNDGFDDLNEVRFE